ncbi:MAG: hypothetical protein AAF943_01420 [Pseudomonadota bacterium]
MTEGRPAVLILGSGPNAVTAATWPKAWFDEIVVINNAWRVRDDWDVIVFPEDFPPDRRPPRFSAEQRSVEADAFVPAQNAFGGFVFAGATMAYTAAYWVLAARAPAVMAFMGCDMMYPKTGPTHFYGTGAPDPLRDDVSLRDLAAKSARLALLAAGEDCACVNLSSDPSSLLFPRCPPDCLRAARPCAADHTAVAKLRAKEDALGYVTPDGRYDPTGACMDIAALDALDSGWRTLFAQTAPA